MGRGGLAGVYCMRRARIFLTLTPLIMLETECSPSQAHNFVSTDVFRISMAEKSGKLEIHNSSLSPADKFLKTSAEFAV